MELRHLRYFVAVAQELHFGRAATRLHMAQPPLSQQIRQLEEEIGVQLLARTKRRVELTAAGAVFLRDALAILENVGAATTRAQRAALGEWGWLGVGFVGSATYDILPVILRRFREIHPDVELVLDELGGEEQEEALRDKRVHIGFTRASNTAPGIVLETLLQEPLLVALPATHPLAGRDSVHLLDLAAQPFVLFRQSSPYSYGESIVRICEAAGFTPRLAQSVGEMQTAIGLVCAGIGVTLVPGTVRNLQREGVTYLPLAAPAPTIALNLIYRADDNSPLLNHFLKVARDAAANTH